MANRFWVGGTGTWDASDTTHWSATSGGAGGASVPGSGDAVTFNGSSGGGTVTVNTNINVQSIDCGAFTGTLDWSVNNNDVTLNSGIFNGSGSATRTIKLGNGTWTLQVTNTNTIWSMGTTVGLTFNAGSSKLNFTGDATVTGARIFQGGGLTYAAVELSGQTKGLTLQIRGANSFGRLTVNGRNAVTIDSNQTIATFELKGTASAPVSFGSDFEGVARTVSVASNPPTISYAAIRDFTGAGGATFVANNSFNMGNNSGITINGPSGGGVAFPPVRAAA